jgi:elongation factor Ts
MPEITAKMVNDLRARTSQPMMDCKKMLTQTGGDLEAAIAEFRKKGIKSSLSERGASEGRVAGVAAEDGSAASLLELNCNTDFTAKSEPFLKLAAKAAKQLLLSPDVDIAQAAAVNADAAEVSQQTGENIRVGKNAVLKAPAVEAAKATGKPQAIAEKIAEGKLNAFFGERVLLDQEFFNAQVFKGTVAAYLKANNVGLEKYVRIEVGPA